MKKQTLLLMGMAFSATISIGQTNETPQAGTEISPEILEELNRNSIERLTSVNADREEINGWVSFELTNYEWVYGADNFYTYGQVISPDTIGKVSFTGGVFRSWTHGFGQMFDPTALDLDINDELLTVADSYEIDSIGFPSIYRKVNHVGPADSLDLTVVITDKVTEAGNPYAGSVFWNPGGLLTDETNVMTPSYEGSTADGHHYGLTGTSDPGSNVEVQKYTFALTDDDDEIFWRAFPVDVSAEADQVVYAFVEFRPSTPDEVGDTLFVFDGAEGVQNRTSYRTVYDYPMDEQVGYFFDLNREDNFTYNASYVEEVNARYILNEGDDEWRNERLSAYSLWGFRFEYYVHATSSVGIDEDIISSFDVYPNPSNKEFTIRLPKSENAGNIVIRDASGKQVFTTTISEIDLTLDSEELGINAGVYFIEWSSDNQSSVQKLILN
ncbi:MAG: T9SS type A sorting domain-containing protein [Flavobacteriales bacterium]|nr:T9SS type A sorting domain-containing protein [Flavobacteriales bacterium]